MSSTLTPTEDHHARRALLIGDFSPEVRERVTALLSPLGIEVSTETPAQSLIDHLRHLPAGTLLLGPDVMRSPEPSFGWLAEPPPISDRVLRSLEIPPMPTAPTQPDNRAMRRAKHKGAR